MGVAKQSETVVTFALPEGKATFGVNLTGVGPLTCQVEYSPPGDKSKPIHEVPVSCGKLRDVLRLTPGEKTVELRIFADATFLEAYFQRGRVVMTVRHKMD